MKRYRSLGAWLLVVCVAVAFISLYDSIYWVFANDNFEWLPSYPKLGAPSDVMEYAVRVLAIISIAWLVVEWRRRALRKCVAEVRDLTVVKTLATANAALFFSVVYWWADPFITWVAKWKEMNEMGLGFWSWGPWYHRWVDFAGADLMAFIPLSLLVVGAELLRRRLGNKAA